MNIAAVIYSRNNNFFFSDQKNGMFFGNVVKQVKYTLE